MDTKYTMLIVEDDADVRHALSSKEEWLARGYELIGVASSGEEGLRLAKLHNPDVVLSDIRMAEMSGLEMIEYLAEHSSEAVFVILSGYNRFQYAQTAVRLGVFEYLSKPVNDRKLDATFERLRLHLNESKRRRKATVKDERTLAIYREIFLTGLLTHQIEEEAARERIAELKLDFPKERMRVAAIWLRRLTLEQEAFADQIASYFFPRNQLAVLYKGCFVVFLNCGDERDEAAALESLDQFTAFAAALPGCDQASVLIGLSSPVSSLTLLNKAYHEAQKALSAHFYSRRHIIRYEELSAIQDDPMLEATAGQLLYIIADAVQKPDPAGASKALDELFDLFDEKRPLNVDRIFSICETLISLFNARLELLGLECDARERPLNCERFSRADTLAALRAEMWRRTGLSLSRVREHMRMMSKDVVWQAQRYIDSHLSERLSVTDVAAAVHMNADYLSRVFKKSTGENLNNYINARKVEQAKDYLRSSSMSVQEIALRLGFSEYRYFSEVFKKMSGSTPLKYRHSLIHDINSKL